MKFWRHVLAINKIRKGINPSGTNWVYRAVFGKYNSISKSGCNSYKEWTQIGYWNWMPMVVSTAPRGLRNRHCA